ncbi:glycosyl transferase [Bacteroidia bacterium]|nr:glycosyl transferase [Bacteroidia bacterium]
MKVSVITVNLNNASGLEKTIRSVVNQKFTDFEYIIIDGGSTDNSLDVILNSQLLTLNSQYVSEPDNGIYHAMNKGIARASGEYLIFMNSGDCFISDDTLLNVFSQKHAADLVVGNIIINGKTVKTRYSVPHKITFYYFMVSTIWHQSTFTKKSLFDEIGYYDEHLKISSDWKFALLALVKYNKSIEIIDEDIALMEANGISGSNEANEWIKKEHDDTIKQYFPYLYNDYKELYRLKRFSFYRLREYIRWRLRKVFYRVD